MPFRILYNDTGRSARLSSMTLDSPYQIVLAAPRLTSSRAKHRTLFAAEVDQAKAIITAINMAGTMNVSAPLAPPGVEWAKPSKSS
jgi:hypothetical protein